MNNFTKIIHVNRTIRPGGGPAGYLYNLKSLAEGFASKKLDFYSNSASAIRSGAAEASSKELIKRMPVPIRIFVIKAVIKIKKIFDLLTVLKFHKIHRGSIPVFHDQLLASAYFRLFKCNYILMPHQPTELAKEADDIYTERYSIPAGIVYESIAKTEVYAYKNAALIITPTKNSLDSYFLASEPHRKILEEKRKLHIVSTVKPPLPTKSREEVRLELGLTDAEIAIGFLGRYNKDKGYDVFTSIANKYEGSGGFRFFSAGAGPLKEVSQIAHKDLGWRSDVANIIIAMDLVLVPNRVAYFDLLPIECLFLGTPVAVTNVGGNKWLLDATVDNSIQQLQVHGDSILDNLGEIIKNKTNRFETENSKILDEFNDKNFVNNHELVLTSMRDLL